MIFLTMLFSNISAINCAPSVVILFCPRLNVVSAYTLQDGYQHELYRYKTSFTVLFCKASAKYCTPVSPISLP
jgi:hypothetical protein